MCGIFGWVGEQPENPQSLFDIQSPLLQHRGPDDHGFDYSLGWGLGFRRLSILDLSHLGHQPMVTPDGRYWLVFNGEIYNYIELREKLYARGERFKSTSDTEVLLKMLSQDGYRALEQLNGMFAFAFIDTVERNFILARDRLGQKPLYYHVANGHLRFASELKALLAWPNAPRQVNYQAVVEYLALGYLSSETCIFDNYLKLPPAHYLDGSIDHPERAAPRPYWGLEINDDFNDEIFTENDLEELLVIASNATQIRLRSDVSVGVFLSGGIDSGLVAALSGSSGTKISPLAFTVGFSEGTHDERRLAESTAKTVGLEHRIILQQPGGLNDIDHLAWFYDEPFGDPSALPTMSLCRAASEFATVFLSGDGGDEAFGGYQRYIKTRRFEWLVKLPRAVQFSLGLISNLFPVYSRIRSRLLKASLPNSGLAAVLDGQGFTKDPALEKILHPSLYGLVDRGADPIWNRWISGRNQNLLARQQALDFNLYLPEDILVKMDRASMANSIEVRSPFLDYRLVEWAGRLSRGKLLNTKEGKIPLRIAGEQLLPADVVRGTKRGFGVPLNEWFWQPDGQAFARERLLSQFSSRRGFWDLKGVESLLDAHKTRGSRGFGEMLWRLLMLEAWARHYLDGANFLQGAPKR